MPVLSYTPLKEIRVAKASVEYVPEVPALPNGAPRISLTAPPQCAIFIKLDYSRSSRLGSSTTREAENKVTKILNQLKSQTLPPTEFQKLIKSATLNAHQVQLGKFMYLWELRYYHQATIQVAEAWRDITEGLALINTEYEFPEQAYRYCDNSVLKYLIALLYEILDPAVRNLQEATTRWVENTKLWICHNYQPIYAYRVLAHMPRTYLEQARYDAAQEATSELKWEREPTEEDVEEAYGAVQDVTLRESFDQPLSTAERRQRAYLPAAQCRRDQAKLYTTMTESSRKRPSSPLEPESYSKQSSILGSPPRARDLDRAYDEPEHMEVRSTTSTRKYSFPNEQAYPAPQVSSVQASRHSHSSRARGVVQQIVEDQPYEDEEKAWTSSDEFTTIRLTEEALRKSTDYKAPTSARSTRSRVSYQDQRSQHSKAQTAQPYRKSYY